MRARRHGHSIPFLRLYFPAGNRRKISSERHCKHVIHENARTLPASSSVFYYPSRRRLHASAPYLRPEEKVRVIYYLPCLSEACACHEETQAGRCSSGNLKKIGTHEDLSLNRSEAGSWWREKKISITTDGCRILNVYMFSSSLSGQSRSLFRPLQWKRTVWYL